MTAFQLISKSHILHLPAEVLQERLAETGRYANDSYVCMTHTASQHQSCTLHAIGKAGNQYPFQSGRDFCPALNDHKAQSTLHEGTSFRM